jgi:eukaryotic-like serine/threonine-protein kinase
MCAMLSGRIGDYEVWGPLSKGGMGEVFLARHAELALPVILKTLARFDGESPDACRARLLDEARLMARLAAPEVVRVLDVKSHDGLPFLVEEYVDGIDLEELRRARREALRRPLPLWAVAELCARAAAGLHAAHQAGVVHRDVKPSNLFGYGHGHVKVGDFGVAVPAAGSAVPVAGTQKFMAPEQMRGEPVDRRADVFGLGATAFVLRYGFMPFGDLVDDATLPRFPPPPTPEEAYFQHVLAHMMTIRPDARYGSTVLAGRRLAALARNTTPPTAVSAQGPRAWDVQGVRVSFAVGDLSRTEADAIINSAHSDMRMTAGVGAALRRAGGDEIEDEACKDGRRALGECVATTAGRLGCKTVLHAVGAWQEVSCVARATHRALLLAERLGLLHIATAAIGTGRGRVALEACADAMIGALRFHLSLGGSKLREVRFVLHNEAALGRFVEAAGAVLVAHEDGDGDWIDGPVEEADASGETVLVPSSSRRS